MRSKAAIAYSAFFPAMLVLSGCSSIPFYRVPKKTSLDYSFSEKEEYFWECPSHKEGKDSLRDIGSFDSLAKAVGRLHIIEEGRAAKKCYEPNDRIAGTNHIASFLHIADAHIRDERLYDQSWFDKQILSLTHRFTKTTKRDPFVDSFDSLTLACFLIAYGNTVYSNHDKLEERGIEPFVIHGGDTLDVSLVTELMEARRILRNASDYYKKNKTDIEIYSVAGNHDGLYFGNLTDERTSTRGLGINKSEFVLGHLVNDPCGYGFGRNEIIRLFKHSGMKDIEDIGEMFGNHAEKGCKKDLAGYATPFNNWKHWGVLKKQYEDLLAASDRLAGNNPNDLKHPLAFRKVIEIPGKTVHAGLKLGYYSFTKSWPVHDPNEPNTIRYIVLDTRSNLKSVNRPQPRGVIDLFQLGWLYAELKKAFKNNEYVVIFAHHCPSHMSGNLLGRRNYTTRILERMLERSPNIIAYFYAHKHPHIYTNGIDWVGKSEHYRSLLIQTGSLIDYPQVGRMVDICVRRPNEPDEIREIVECRGQNKRDFRAVDIHWEYVRPRGNVESNAPNALLVESILENSLHLARKTQGEDGKVVKKWEGRTKKEEDRIEMKGKATVLIDFSKTKVSFDDEDIVKDFFLSKRIKDTVWHARDKMLPLKDKVD
ncbi:MAG: metallophosphoesterase family protein [Planctomycetota bacterium]|jgi:3',5'-cyclic AMP phosphodiesterase CpdA